MGRWHDRARDRSAGHRRGPRIRRAACRGAGVGLSKENVEVVRRWGETWNTGEPDFSIYHPALVYHPRADEPDPSPHNGREAFERLALGFLDAFPNPEFDVEELIDAHDLVIALTVMRGRGRVSGADVTDE